MKKINFEGASIDAVLLTFIKLVTAVLGLAVTRLLSEYLEIHEYGTYSQIMLLVSTIGGFTIFGMMDGANYFFCRESDREKREAYISTIWAFQCFLSTIVGAAVMLLAQPLCRYFGNPDVKGLLIFAALLPWMQNLLWIIQVLIVSVGKAKALAIRNLVVALIRLASVLVVVFLIKNVAVVLTTTLIMDLAQIVLFLIVLRKHNCYIRMSKIDISLFGDILKYCAPMAIFIIVNSLNRDMDKYLISMMTDTETLALYANASKQLPFDILMTSFGTVLVPHIIRFFAEDKHEKALKIFKIFLELTYVSVGALCFAALSSAPQLMKLLYSNKYTDGLNIFCIYILADFFRITTNITIVLTAAAKTKLLMFLGIGTMLINALMNVVLYNLLGIVGPAIATVAVTIIVGVIMLCCDAKIFHVGLFSLFNIKYLLLFVGEGVAATVLLAFLGRFLDKMDVHYFIILMIVAGLCGVLLLLLNVKRFFNNMKSLNSLSKDYG